MAKKDLSYKYNTCTCGARKLKRASACRSCTDKVRNGHRFGRAASKCVSLDGCCVVCHAKLKPRQKAFCGLACRFTHVRIPERQCKCCGQAFKPKSSKVRYCTNKCANLHKSEIYRQPESKAQKSKTTVNGCKIGKSCQLSYTPCILCSKKRPTLQRLRFCSGKCQRRHSYLAQCARGLRKRTAGLTVCQWCGSKRFNAVHANKSFCSVRCSSKHSKSQRKHRKKAARSECGINWRSAVKRFGWTCSRCLVECVRPQGFNLPNEATLDHIHPLSKGGSHTWDNVQVLCRKCNTIKSDSHVGSFDTDALTE